MRSGYKILHIEDVATDAELIARELKTSGIVCDITLVDSEAEYENALDSNGYDLILCDHLVPGFNSHKALTILKQRVLTIPFIIVTATMTEEVAIAMVRDGADDYIIKDRLKRLPHAVENAVEKFRNEKDRKRLVDNLYDKETLSRELSTHLSNKMLQATKIAGIGVWEYIFDKKKFVADEVMLLQFDMLANEYSQSFASFLERLAPQDREGLIARIAEQIKTGTEFILDYRILWGDGSYHYFKASAIIERNIFGGIARIIGSNQDVTADRVAELKIKESESRMSEAQRMAKIGSWETDLVTMDVIWSAETCRIFDVEDCVEETTHENFLKFVHPEDRILVNESFANSIGGMDHHAVEHRIITATGKLKYVEENWRFIYNEEGHPEKAIGTIQDITSSKQATLRVLESEAKYRSLIETSMDAILLTVKTGEILAVNTAACIYFKMTEQELLQSKRGDIVDVDDPRFAALFKERDIMGQVKGELNFIRKDKTVFPAEISSVIFTNADGEERISVVIRDISSRKNAEKKLQETTNELKEALERMNNVMDSSLDVICSVSSDGIFRQVSAASELVWGYGPSELIGRRFLDFVYCEDIDKTVAMDISIRSGEPTRNFQNRYVKKDGSLVHIEWTSLWNEEKQLTYCVARDITEKKWLEKAFDMERKRFEGLYAQAPSCMGILKGPDHVFELANPLYLQLIGKTDIIGKTVKELMPELESQGIFTFLDNVYQTGESFSANEMLVQLDIAGTGELVDTYLNFIYQAHRNIEGDIDGIFFFAIDVTEQVLSRKKIDDSRKRYQQIVQTAQEGIWLVDDKDNTTFVNEKLCDMFGYSREEMLGKDMYYFMDEAGIKIARDLMDRKRKGEAGIIHHRYISKAKKEIWTQVSANPLFDDKGVYIGALAMITDITEFKKAEEVIKASEKRYRNLFEQNLAGFYQSTLDGKIIHCNDAFAKMFKYNSPEDIMSVNASELYFTNQDRSQFIQKIVDSKNLYNYEGVSKCKDGSAMYFLENVAVHINPITGVEYFDGTIIDISEKKAAELQLKESNERFINVGKATFDIIWEWDIETDTLFLAERFREVFGYVTPEKDYSLLAWSAHIHPEDRERVLESLAHKVASPGINSWESEYRYICEKGRICHIADKGILLINEHGQRRMIGAKQDITEKKNLETLLQRASSLATIGSWEFDLIKHKVYWSDTVREIFEVDADFEPLGFSVLDFGSEVKHIELLKEKIHSAISLRETWDIEVNIKTFKGNQKWIRMIGEPEHFNGECTRVYGSCQDINERKMSELAVVKAFNEKNTILESIGDAFFAVDHNWNVTYWNSQAESIFNTSKTDIINKNLWEVFVARVDSTSYHKYHEAMVTQQATVFDDYDKTLDKWFEISAYPSESGLSVYCKDVTDRRQADKAVRASEEIRKLIMDASMDAIICINAAGMITVWNPQAEKIFGWSEQSVLGKLLSDIIIPANLREGHNHGMVNYHKTGYGPILRKAFETTAINSMGNEFPIELSILPIQQGETEFFCAFIRDISARKQSEEKVSELHNNLLEQSKKLMTSNEELENYAYVTSHDLQEPLRMVTSFLQLLQKKYDHQLDDTAQKYINFAVDGAGRMKTLILDLLEFSRIRSVDQDHKIISLNDVVSTSLLSLKASIDETNCIVYVPQLPEVSGNEIQLLQLFQNLLSNAIKYKGAEDPVIRIDYSETDTHFQFAVKDNGIGIDPKFYEKIFVIFQRLHNKKNYKGTGIGLAICKKIVELHNGKIWVESAELGSVFHFTIQKVLQDKKFVENLN